MNKACVGIHWEYCSCLVEFIYHGCDRNVSFLVIMQLLSNKVSSRADSTLNYDIRDIRQISEDFCFTPTPTPTPII